MSFFKEFKEDLSEAVDGLLPEGGSLDTFEEDEDLMVNTLDESDIQAQLDKIDEEMTSSSDKSKSLFSTAAAQADEDVQPVDLNEDEEKEDAATDDSNAAATETTEATANADGGEDMSDALLEPEKENETVDTTTFVSEKPQSFTEPVKFEPQKPVDIEAVFGVPVMPEDDEIAVITKGMTITGDLDAQGSVELRGVVNGNVRTSGKMVISGRLKGNATSKEFFADSARVDGEINSEGSVKVGNGSVIVGNIVATSAVIAGAVKGDLDVHGPVIIDTTAIIVGNIKSKSVQINNGAVIEGFCSQVYADVDVDELFGKAAGE